MKPTHHAPDMLGGRAQGDVVEYYDFKQRRARRVCIEWHQRLATEAEGEHSCTFVTSRVPEDFDAWECRWIGSIIPMPSEVAVTTVIASRTISTGTDAGPDDTDPLRR